MRKLNDIKLFICQHSWVQCTKVFESVQELKFHLQNIHCVKLRKELKQFSSKSKVDTRSCKIRCSENTNVTDIDIKTEVRIKQKYQFVNEATKLQSWNVSQKLTTSSISLNHSISTLNWNVNSVECSTETPSLSTCSDELNKINPRLCAEATPSFVGSSLSLNNNNTITISFHNATKVVNLISLDSELTYSLTLTDFFEHTVTSQCMSWQSITLFITFDQIDNNSAARYKHDKDNSLIIIKFALDEGLININSVEHDEN